MRILLSLLFLFSISLSQAQIVVGNGIVRVYNDEQIAQVTKHAKGFDYSIDMNTDVIFADKFFGTEAAHYKNNIGYTVFADSQSSNLFDDISKGLGNVDMYFRTTDVSNNDNDVSNQIDLQNTYLPENTTVASLRNGNTTYVPAIENSGKIAGVRNSGVSSGLSSLENNYSNLSDVMSKYSTTRFANNSVGSNEGSRDVAITASEINYMKAALISTKGAEGVFTNFSHWHWVYDFVNQCDDYELMLSEIKGIAGEFYNGGYRMITEYLWLREKSSLISYEGSNNDVFVRVTTKKNEIPSFSQFNQTLTVEYENAAWTGLSCDNCKGVRKAGSVYFIDVYPNSVARLYESSTANYYDYTVPVVINQSVTGNTINITTNVPTVAKLYRNETGESIFESEYIPVFSNSYSTSHSFDITGLTSGFDFEVGICTETNQSSLTKIN